MAGMARRAGDRPTGGPGSTGGWEGAGDGQDGGLVELAAMEAEQRHGPADTAHAHRTPKRPGRRGWALAAGCWLLAAGSVQGANCPNIWLRAQDGEPAAVIGGPAERRSAGCKEQVWPRRQPELLMGALAVQVQMLRGPTLSP